MTAATLKLHAKLAEVMAEAERIPKNGTAPAQMGSYKFVQIGDAADHIRVALGSRKVSMLPSTFEVIGQTEHPTTNNKTMTTVEVRITWTLTDGETGEQAVIQSYGVGADTGDKYSGKATTNAMKYALLSGFLLSTGDDVEREDTSDRLSGGESEPNLLGNITKSGTFVKGNVNAGYGAEWRETPTGHAIGVRMKVDDKDIPQVLITGTIGEALWLRTEGDPKEIIGRHVTVKGKLYGVSAPGRATYYRLVIGEYPDSDFVETPDYRIPAAVTPLGTTETAAEPTEAVSVPLPFDASDMADVDDER